MRRLDNEAIRQLDDGANATQTDAGGGMTCQPTAVGGVGLKASAKPEKPAALPLDKADLRSERPSGKAREDFARERTNACVTEQNSSSNEASGPLSPQISVIVNHLAPDCTSRQLVKGIALGGSTAPVAGSFNGTIYVAREAQRTDAQQYNRNIIVGDGAVITTRPQMEIYADDVRCNHGATIGQLDDEAVFYMCQRGLSETEARHLLLQGFAHEITDRLSDNTLRDEIVSKIDSLIK